ncbi:baseplate multidomain protein megatron [Brevundimonas sp.]|uniref:baseplate multidomain protein megatron n=2 Tax=Brevundimonas sp. TaxID=1871086 RepID=UPI002FC9E03D
MTQVAFAAVGGFFGGPVGAAIGGMIGGMVDSHLVNSLKPARQIGPRLEGLKLLGAAQGAPMACVFGRTRVTGQVIWAARFREEKRKSSGGKSGQRSVDYGYSLSFAVALCEGEIDGVGRIWADGMAMDMSGVNWRVHKGGEGQMPDPLITAVEGTAPAYRGTAYVVFEDLPLEAYGDRVPQLAFEVFRRARGETSRLEDQVKGVCLIPGAGEFCLATDVVLRREGMVRTKAENAGAGLGLADIEVSLDQLVTQLPHVGRVNLVVGWFGTDVRAGHCKIRPGVERRDKPTQPLQWSVAGLDRAGGHVISQGADGAVAYGGTPSDEAVRQAIRAIKARGLEVVLYPFVFMDCEGYPWRGRVAGRDGAEATADVSAVFGDAGGWGLRRQALHYARMAREEGADGLIIGSEMRGLTLTRDAAGGFPAVAQYRALAAECRAEAGAGVKLGYAADWSEYAGLRDGGEVRFHLDPLWADPDIDFVGIDWYPPMGDWRDGGGGLDGALYAGPQDGDYLAGQVAGGRDFDWYYASAEDEAAQVRTPISDGAYGEDWVWRVKDLKGWWSNPHYERVGGVRLSRPTDWVAGMKPVRLTEIGCAAVDRGGNAPNLFFDPKSSESALPAFSTGARDDAMQRGLLEVVLGHFAKVENNPVSAVYGGPMVSGADVWCWDARPYPAFPARVDMWADAPSWRTGHWLNGRMSGEASDIVAAVLQRAGVAADGYRLEVIKGAITGLVLDRPMTTRAVLDVLLLALGAVVSEKAGGIVVSGDRAPDMKLSLEALAMPLEGGPVVAERRLQDVPQGVRVRFIGEAQDYQTGAVMVRADRAAVEAVQAAPLADVLDVDLPMVVGDGLARTVARRVLAVVQGERLKLRLGPLEAMQVEAGDAVEVEGRGGVWRVVRVAYEEEVVAELEPWVVVPPEDAAEDWRGGDGGIETVGAPWVRLLDLPLLPREEGDLRPVVAVAVDPWWPMSVHGGAGAEALALRGEVIEGAQVGELVEPLGAGPLDRWDHTGRLMVRLSGGSLASRTAQAVLDGANRLAVEGADGWEIVQFCRAQLLGDEVWLLSGLLRGRLGTGAEAGRTKLVGAAVVMLEGSLPRLDMGGDERGVERLWRIGPKGLAPAGARFSELRFVWHRRGAMPWRPAHLRQVAGEDGIALDWQVCVRTGGDGWGEDVAEVDPRRFRLRVLAGGEDVREWQVHDTQALYTKAQQQADFPHGMTPDVTLAVAQWSDGWGWGEEALLRLK